MIFVRQNDPNFESGATIVETSDETTGRSGALVLEMAKHRLNENIWFIEPAKVGDQAWLDENGNGLMDGGERMLPGVKVTLWMDGVKAYETETDAAGYYLFDQVYPGTYILQAEAYPELEIAQSVEGLRLISSCLTAGDGTQARSRSISGGERLRPHRFQAGLCASGGRKPAGGTGGRAETGLDGKLSEISGYSGPAALSRSYKEASSMEKAKVYFTDFRTPYGGDTMPGKLKKLIRKAGIAQLNLEGQFVAIKIHFGELGNVSYLRPNYARAVVDVVKELGGKPFLTDCNTPVSRQPEERAGTPVLRVGKRLHSADGRMPHPDRRRP